MKTILQHRDKQAFTLIELMVVILVIAILAGILFAGVSGAIKRAKRLQAQATVTALAAAFRQYYTEYGRWPTTSTGNLKVDANMVDMLTGNNNPTYPNAKRIVFMEISTNQTTSSGLSTPWVSSSGVNDNHKYYWCKFDVNNQGYVDSAGYPNPTRVNMGLAVWTTEPFPDRIVSSW